MHQVNMEIQNSPQGFSITMDTDDEMESFVGCLSGYYRLMVKWNVDLCSNLASPSLEFLTRHKIHGPIGGSYSYGKIEEKNSSIGSFIVRQCEKTFDTYYIDIVTTKERNPDTFKILFTPADEDPWKLWSQGSGNCPQFHELTELAKSIPIDGNHFRLPPTQHDKSPLLLLCQSFVKLVTKEPTTSLRSPNPVLLSAADLTLYKWSQREFGDGIFTKMKAEYVQPNRKTIEVTLKVLKPNEVAGRFMDFAKLTDKWAKLDLSEIVRMHGLTLHPSFSMVLESIKCGPLDEFLRKQENIKYIKTLHLVETAYSLAKALHYLVS